MAVTWLIGPHLFRPAGFAGVGIWMLQVAVVGLTTAVVVERISRRMMPMVNLLGMTLTFPDQAPSRFGVALRSGTVRQLEKEVENLRLNGVSSDAAEAAAQLLVLVSALGKHERLTRGHTERVRAYSELIGQELGLSAADQNRLRWGSLIHDIGKLAVPAPILSKQEQLEDAEWQTIKLHPEVGAALVQPLEDWLGDWRLAASEHHERWDGTGYPQGLAGTEISLAGRIIAVADTYDVITSTRSYKTASTADEARKELVRCAGTQFDPTVVKAFLAISVGRLHPIAGRFAWIASFGLLFQQAPVAIQTAMVGGAAAAALTVGAATGAIEIPEPPDSEIGVATERSVDSDSTDGFVFPSIPGDPQPSFEEAATIPVPGSEVLSPDSTVPGSVPPTTAAVSGSTSTPSSSTTPTITTSTASPPTTSTIANTTTSTTSTTSTTVPDDCAQAQGGQLTLTGADLTGCDLAGLDLAGATLDQSDLTGADLTGTNLTSAILSNADVTGASFVGAMLDDARLAGVDAIGTNFTDASMRDVRLGGADLTGANFTRADLTWSVGNPANHGAAVWFDTICPSGVVQSTDCYA
ncbi:MAG: HD domain-containing phosphohydrolase [Acidimicrobiales bacterium]